MPFQEDTQAHIQDLLSDLTNAKDDLHELAAPLEAQIEILDRELLDLTRPAQNLIAALERDVRREVLNYGKTVKSTQIWAVYNRGRVSWDTRALVGYSKAHPEVLEFHKQGHPYVSIRKAKGVK